MKNEEIALLLSIACNIIQIWGWWTSAQRKRFAAENDFLQIKHMLDALLKGQQNIEKLVDAHEEATYRRVKEAEGAIVNELKELKGINNALIVKLTGDSISNVLSRKEREQNYDS